jgi:hypothetical protein
LTAAPHSRRTRPRLAVVALVVCLGAVSACGGLSTPSTTTMPQGATAANPVVPPKSDAAELEKLSTHRSAPVYWLGERDATVYLYREYVEAEDQGDPITTSIKHMLEQQPTDPDYFSLWSPASRIGTSIDGDNVITVDLSADAFARQMDAGLAERAVQQLVYTATGAAANAGLLTGSAPARVAVLVDGRPGYEAFGHVRLDGPTERVSSLRAPVWIIEPHHGGAYAAGNVAVRGAGAVFPGGIRWEVRRVQLGGPGDVVSDGRITLGAGDLPADEFEFAVDLGEGDYDVSVWGQNGVDTARLSEDTKRITVAGG